MFYIVTVDSSHHDSPITTVTTLIYCHIPAFQQNIKKISTSQEGVGRYLKIFNFSPLFLEFYFLCWSVRLFLVSIYVLSSYILTHYLYGNLIVSNPLHMYKCLTNESRL